MLGLLVLIQFNRFTIWLAIGSLAIVAIYPFMKRITIGRRPYWASPSTGVRWSAGLPSPARCSFAALLLYAGGIFWTLAYDTIYAHQDMEDDILIGVKSTALLVRR